MKPKCIMLLDYIDELINAYDNFITHDDETIFILMGQINTLAKNRYKFNNADASLLYFTDKMIESFEIYVRDNMIGDGMGFERFNDLLDKIKILKGYREERITYKRQNQVLPLEKQ